MLSTGKPFACGSVIMPAVIHPEKWEPDRLLLSSGLTETKQQELSVSDAL
jgi:hypothetical protein